jgi:kynurenine aminotransferase
LSRYEYQVKIAGGTIRYVPIRPPEGEPTGNGNDWIVDMAELERAINDKTKMIYLNNPYVEYTMIA